MGSHSVTYHPAEVTFPPLPQPKLVLDYATPEGCKAELTLKRNSTVSVRLSLCPAVRLLFPQQQTRCCRLAAVSPAASRRYRSIATGSRVQRPNAGSATLSAVVGSWTHNLLFLSSSKHLRCKSASQNSLHYKVTFVRITD